MRLCEINGYIDLVMHVAEVDPRQIVHHLRYLVRVVQYRSGSLGEVVQRGVAAQGLGERHYRHHL